MAPLKKSDISRLQRDILLGLNPPLDDVQKVEDYARGLGLRYADVHDMLDKMTKTAQRLNAVGSSPAPAQTGSSPMGSIGGILAGSIGFGGTSVAGSKRSAPIGSPGGFSIPTTPTKKRRAASIASGPTDIFDDDDTQTVASDKTAMARIPDADMVKLAFEQKRQWEYKMTKAKQEIEDLKKDKEDLEAALNAARGDADNSKAEIDTLKQEVAQLQQQVTVTNQAVANTAQLQQSLTASQTQAADLQAKVADLEQQIANSAQVASNAATLEQTLASSRTHAATLAAQVLQLQTDVDEKEEILEEHEEKIRDLKLDVDVTEKKLVTVTKEKDDVQEKLDEALEEVQVAQTLIAQLRDAMKGMRTRKKTKRASRPSQPVPYARKVATAARNAVTNAARITDEAQRLSLGTWKGRILGKLYLVDETGRSSRNRGATQSSLAKRQEFTASVRAQAVARAIRAGTFNGLQL